MGKIQFPEERHTTERTIDVEQLFSIWEINFKQFV